jgi:asparagine synthase (glutamine-hydrolysing)
MCSILGILDIRTDPQALRARALELSRRMRHRGPDWSGIFADERAVLAHERLAIVDVVGGAQPLANRTNPEAQTYLAVNGEIYNHRELRRRFPDYPFETDSDCEVILALYERHGADFLNELSGIFAFALYQQGTDQTRSRYLVARDPIGVMPLYRGWDEDGNLYVASEMKALIDVCKRIEDFPPGHYLDSETCPDGEPRRYYEPPWRDYDIVAGNPLDLGTLRTAFEDAVHRQLMTDVPYGLLLSGGLDSSLVAAVAARFRKTRIEADDQTEAWWPQLHTFSIGLAESPDLRAARKVADALGTVHHEFQYTVQEGHDALSDVIYHLETFDVTTVRASTPMYLLARRIRSMGIKMVLSGEGADEVFGGYLYFHKAPDARAFHEETVLKLDLLHKYDCLRANKSMAAWSIEARVPFLDREFLDVAMAFDPGEKMTGPGRMEKYPLRKAFDGVLPPEILWRQKEQFSDGVGYSWIDSLKALAEEQVTDDQLERAAFRFPYNPPATKEAYLYRTIFETHFPGEPAAACVPSGASIACSTPNALEWDAAFKTMADPSGRAVQGVHDDSY